MSKVYQVADSTHGSIQLSKLEKKIIDTHIFNRLHDVMQNSTAFLTFPSNQTKRFSHSLGTMHIAGQMFYYSIVNAEKENRDIFLKELKNGISDILKDQRNSRILRDIMGKKTNLLDNEEYLKFYIDDLFYKSKIPFQLSEDERFIYIVTYQALRCAALLHDVGHPPFSHITEYAIVDVFNKIKDLCKKTKRQEEFIRIIKRYYQEDKEKINIHEIIGNNITTRLLEQLEYELKNEDKVEEKLFYFLVNQITHKILNSEENDKNQNIFADIHQIVSGSVDADRLDYVCRDTINSGFNKGLIEFDRLLLSMRLMVERNNSRSSNIVKFRFCFDIRVLNTIEDYFRRRWDLYKYFIYHHRVRKTDSILQKIIIHLCLDYLSKNDEEDSVEYNCLPMNISGLWKAIMIATDNQKYFNSLIQWNDSWLITILRFLYFTEGYKDEEVILCLEEFLSNKKNYYSLIKRRKDFMNLDQMIAEKVKKSQDLIEVLVNLRNSEKNKNRVIKNSIENILSLIENEKNSDKIKYRYTEKGFITENFLKIIIASCPLSQLKYKEIINNSIRKAADDLNLKSYILKFNELKTGVKNVFLHEGDKILLLKDNSRIQVELQNDEMLYPQFYLFVSEEISNKEQFCEEITKNFVLGIKSELNKILSQFA